MRELSDLMWGESGAQRSALSGYGLFAIGIFVGLVSGFAGILLSA
ncbi:MAG: hypothetical protein OEY84_02060 [Rhodospirillaceae bacterium]|nr:hypothetical protein [Rhodospirillaceae bacterium]